MDIICTSKLDECRFLSPWFITRLTFSWLKYLSSLISLNVLKQNMACSKGWMRFMATVWPVGLCKAELQNRKDNVGYFTLIDDSARLSRYHQKLSGSFTHSTEAIESSSLQVEIFIMLRLTCSSTQTPTQTSNNTALTIRHHKLLHQLYLRLHIDLQR